MHRIRMTDALLTLVISIKILSEILKLGVTFGGRYATIGILWLIRKLILIVL